MFQLIKKMFIELFASIASVSNYRKCVSLSRGVTTRAGAGRASVPLSPNNFLVTRRSDIFW